MEHIEKLIEDLAEEGHAVVLMVEAKSNDDGYIARLVDPADVTTTLYAPDGSGAALVGIASTIVSAIAYLNARCNNRSGK